jgi:hypothetical protein
MNEQDKQIGKKLQGIRKVKLIDGVEYEIFFSINAIINLIAKHGSLKNVFAEFEKGDEMDFNVFLDFIFEGFQTRNKDIPKEQLGDLIDFFDFPNLTKQIFGTMQDNLPSDEKNGK